MKFSVSTREIVSLISKILNVIPVKPAIPILSNLLVEASNGQLIFTGTDMTVSIKAYVDASVEEDGIVAIPARRFFQLCKELTTPTLSFSSSKEGKIHISSGSSKFIIHGMNKSDYPEFPELSDECTFTINSNNLKSMLTKTSFAAAKDDSRQVLNGVYTVIEKQKLTFVGTDGKRLAKITEKNPLPIQEDISFIIPLKAVDEIVRIADGEEEAKIVIDRDKISVEIGAVTLTTKLLAGKYPDVNRVIPKKETLTHVTIHKDELTTLLKQVSLFTSELNYSVKFTFESGTLYLQAISNDIGEGKVSMPVNFHDTPVEIAFNPHFFLDVLRHCKDETATFGVSDSYNPGLITDSTTAEYVIMPMRLSSE